MCGIAGLIADVDPDEARTAVDAMLDAEFHRGPDSGGSYVVRTPTATVGLGTRRLAILDTSDLGAQPMVDEATGNVLVYNGEIYNFRSLRSELEAAGFVFRSRSDTEVLLKAYARWGTDAVARL